MEPKKIMIAKIDEDRLRSCCVRSALVMIAYELDKLLDTPDLRRWCSNSTIELIKNIMQAKNEARITRAVVLFARRAAQLGSSMTWGSYGDA